MTTPIAAAYDIPATAAVWSELRAGVIGLDYEARMKCRQLVSNTFSAVQIYARGVLPSVPGGSVDVVLVSKTNNRRWLRINRTTGKFMGGLNLNGDVG